MLPIVINEQSTQSFNFYLYGGLREGMQFQGELYGRLHQFSTIDRLRTYQTACELAEQGIESIVTASDQRYAVWINLRIAGTQAETLFTTPSERSLTLVDAYPNDHRLDLIGA